MSRDRTGTANILEFAASLSSKSRRKRQPEQKGFRRQDLFIPIDRQGDVISLADARERGLVRGSLPTLYRKVRAGEMKAVKMTGIRGWAVLPEWLEEFNNAWAGGLREKGRS